MATVIGLGMQITASASGMAKGLSEADKALRDLGKIAGDSAKLFDQFKGSTEAAAAAQSAVSTDFKLLATTFQSGLISAEEFKQGLAEIAESARNTAAAFAEGQKITEAVLTAEERRTKTLQRLDQLLQQGAISQQTYERAAADASGANEQAATAEEARAKAIARAAQITANNLTPMQKYDQEVLELQQHLAAGRISQETFNSALAKATASFAKAESAAKGYDAAVESAGKGGTLQFNELSGILSALPGPIGNVAGRLSGLASAGEGLGRVFSGGVSQGLSGLGASVAGLINPFTAGLAAVAAFGAGAAAVAQSLVELEDRVEKLGNLADQLGVSFEFIQVLEEAANRSGVSVETLSGSMTRLQKTLAGADEESKAATAALARLGVSVEEINALSQKDQIRLIGDRLAEIQDPAQRTAAAMALFGKSGASLLPFFKNLSPAAADIERFGKVLNDIDRGRIDDFGAGLDALGVATRGLTTELTLPFAGLGEGITKGAAEFIGGVNAIVGPIGDVLEPILSGLGDSFELLGSIFGTVGRIIGAVLEPLGTIFQGLGQAFEPFRTAVVDSVQAFGDAAVATTEWLVSFTPLGAIADNIGAIGEVIGRVATIIGTAFSQITEYIGGVVSSFGEFIAQSPLIERIGNTISTVFGAVSSTFQTIANAIGGFVGRLLTIAENFLGIERSSADAKDSVEDFKDLGPPEGFVDFEKAIGNSRDALNKAIEESAEFGQAGFDAALQFQQSLERLQQQAEDGILNETAYKAEVDKATEAYRSQIDTIKEAQKAEEEKAKAAERAAQAAIDADQKRVDAFIQSQGLGSETPQQKNAEDLLAITRQIDEAEAAIVQARAAGDKEAENAALKRLAILDQAEAAAQEKVEFGFTTTDANQAIEKIRSDLEESIEGVLEFGPAGAEAAQAFAAKLADLENQLELKLIDPQQFEEAAKQARDSFKEESDRAKRLFDLKTQYQEQLAEIEQDRVEELSRASQKPLVIEDVRTSGGFSEFVRLASGRDDPAIEEYRQQTRELRNLRKDIQQLGGTVEIIGA